MPDGDPASTRGTFGRAAARRRLVVSLTDGGGRALRVAGLADWLRRVAPARATGLVSVALVSDAQIRELNRRYRRKNYATDVLSFPSVQPPVPFNPQSAVRNPQLLGDIVVARGVARRQAREAGHAELTELKILVLHGLLHLLGYDHERDAGRMLRVERRLRKKGGLREGLIERARSGSR
jgi:probable rRNA maturation factor